MLRPFRNPVRRPATVAWAVVVALLFGAAAAQAQWKWRDGRGQLHISDRPPPVDVPEANILQRPPGPAPRVAAVPPSAPASDADGAASAVDAKARTDPALEARRQAAEQERLARAQAERERAAAARTENCSRARSALQALESGQRVSRTNAQGEREFLDDAARQREADRARQVVAADCGK